MPPKGTPDDSGRGRGRGRGRSGERGGGRGSFDRGGSRGGSPARGSSPVRGPPRGGPPRGGAPFQGPTLPTSSAPAERRTLALASHVQAIGVKRPGHGTAGSVVDIFTNHFATTLDQGTIYHYNGMHSFLSQKDVSDKSSLRSARLPCSW
jgi:eukaryotic translation initiation factor 2C